MLLEARVEIVAGGDKAGRYNQNAGYPNPSSTILPTAVPDSNSEWATRMFSA